MSILKKGILFLCTGNSCRSQMAEGFARNMLLKDVKIYSAGVDPKGMHPVAIKVMQEVGIDISEQKSKNLWVCRFGMEYTIPFAKTGNYHQRYYMILRKILIQPLPGA